VFGKVDTAAMDMDEVRASLAKPGPASA